MLETMTRRTCLISKLVVEDTATGGISNDQQGVLMGWEESTWNRTGIRLVFWGALLAFIWFALVPFAIRIAPLVDRNFTHSQSQLFAISNHTRMLILYLPSTISSVVLELSNYRRTCNLFDYCSILCLYLFLSQAILIYRYQLDPWSATECWILIHLSYLDIDSVQDEPYDLFPIVRLTEHSYRDPFWDFVIEFSINHRSDFLLPPEVTLVTLAVFRWDRTYTSRLVAFPAECTSNLPSILLLLRSTGFDHCNCYSPPLAAQLEYLAQCINLHPGRTSAIFRTGFHKNHNWRRNILHISILSRFGIKILCPIVTEWDKDKHSLDDSTPQIFSEAGSCTRRYCSVSKKLVRRNSAVPIIRTTCLWA